MNVKPSTIATPLSRRRWLAVAGAGLLAPFVGCADGRSSQPSIRSPALRRAIEWLTGPDHLSLAPYWQSKHYSMLGREVVTPLVLVAAGNFLPADRRRNALTFVRDQVSLNGIVGGANAKFPDYPVYATSLALQSLIVAAETDDAPLIDRLTKFLVAQQYCEANGFDPEHPTYGGWGYYFSGPRPLGSSPGHMDLGHTRHVLAALRAAGHADPQTYARAEKFLHRLQKRDTPGFDGGFFFSPIVTAANKGGEETIDGKTYFRSYATTTCDGILALLACGVKPSDERIQSAVAWLKKHPRLDFPEGVLEGTDTNWGASIRFYHFAARAECYAALDWPGDWRSELRTILEKLQQPDGSFVNREGFLMKEDDPLLCTALAVIALSHAQ